MAEPCCRWCYKCGRGIVFSLWNDHIKKCSGKTRKNAKEVCKCGCHDPMSIITHDKETGCGGMAPICRECYGRGVQDYGSDGYENRVRMETCRKCGGSGLRR